VIVFASDCCEDCQMQLIINTLHLPVRISIWHLNKG
jgi:hypothetical protein